MAPTKPDQTVNGRRDAIAEGAKLMCGHERRGALYAPTVLDRVRPDMEVVRLETFGPVSASRIPEWATRKAWRKR